MWVSSRITESVPVLAGNRLKRLTELEHRISKASVPQRGRSRAFRDYQHFNWLSGLEWKPFQNEFAILTDCSFSPVCLHGQYLIALSRGAGLAVVSGVSGVSREEFIPKSASPSITSGWRIPPES
jgi:hypothetical protein